ncbi:Stp1/IreP family PP2C-type Ser/Thr phosphatase [Oxalicibacterium faecigallinarum]|uniref:PPM-type phosphatase domain-containing protein n=1 Tax=Oxalicibacterium faecigallinarum TaxID=573741 RepID=A0A8J3AQ31_9BURK|nr:Stp1/IreP family PP2C-type Ser/Thr phosphatase [Oxalicibacterium faecigallinarum]GGI18588.1 hypothetical protein GCM10008066_14830 [Oxalicibacterium faecigallinarum]
MTPSVVLKFAAKTDTGLVRTHNEDAIAFDEACNVLVLADGMGGYNAGEVASRLATEFVRAELVQRLAPLSREGPASILQLQKIMREVVGAANDHILNAALAEPAYRGMGTTLVAALFDHDRVVLAHLGDSRCYRFRQGVLTQLTHDHSQVQEQIDAGLVPPDWGRFAPNKNLITRALGVAAYIDTEISDHVVQEGDLYLLCSDGLSDMLDADVMTAMLQADTDDLELLAEALVHAANQQGGRDNISVLVAQVQSCSKSPQIGTIDRLKNWLSI